MIRFSVIVLLVVFGISTAAGQHRVDRKSLETAIKTLRQQTNVPLKIPTYFPFMAGSTPRERRRPLYASVVANPDGFGLDLCFSRQTCNGAYFYAEISGEKITAEIAERPATDKAVKLARGIVGYFQEGSCGASCAPESISWDQDGYRYTAFLSADKLTIASFVNSAINNIDLPPSVHSSEKFQSVEAFLKAILERDDKSLLDARGDLNSDGREDWAGLIQRKKEPRFKEDGRDTDQTVQLYILLREPQGSFVVAGRSKESGTFGIGNLYFEDLSIKDSSLYIQLNGGAKYRSLSQFKLYRGEWRLIGWQETDITAEPSDDVFTSSRKDRNLLTGTVIESWQTDDSMKVVRRYKKMFPRVLLRDFGLYGSDLIQ